MMKKLLAIVAASGAAVLVLAGCAASGTPTAAVAPTTVTVTAKVTVTDVTRTTEVRTNTSTQTVTVTPEIVTSEPPIVPGGPGGANTEPYLPPEGYQIFGIVSTSTTSYRFLNNEEFECSETDDSCWGLSVHTQTGCSDGGSATLTVSIKDSDAAPLGEITGTLAASAPNEAVPVVIGQVGLRPTPETALTARLSSVTCSS
jgi:hypothetical protein